MQYYDRYLRWLYRAGRPNVFARMQNRASAAAFAMGIWPRRAAALEVRGRVSGRVISLPVVIVDYEGERYLVSMLGENVDWVRNAKSAGGEAVLIHGITERVELQELAIAERAPILKAYLRRAPGARPHFDISVDAPLEDFERIAAGYPVFRVKKIAAT